MPLEEVVDGDPGPDALPREVVATLGGRDEVLGELRPANPSERLELGQLELPLGLHAGVLDRAGVDGADTRRPSVVLAISRTRGLNFGSFSPSARKANASSIGRSITTV